MSSIHFKMDVAVAEKDNPAIMEILWDMKLSMAEKAAWQYSIANYMQWHFISKTTGPVAVSKTLQNIGYQPHVKVFSMCRPLFDLENVIELDETGRVTCKRRGLESYDVLSAFTNNYVPYGTRKPRPPPPLARPLPQPPPSVQRKRRRCTSKKPELLDGEVKQRRIDYIGDQPHVHL